MKKKEYRVIPEVGIYGDTMWVLQERLSFLFWKYWNSISSSIFKHKSIEKMHELESEPVYSESYKK